MDAVTIRRMIVFGVCTLGVAALYLVPSVTGTSSPVGMPRTADEPPARTSGRAPVRAPQAGATGVGQPIDIQSPASEPTRTPAEQRRPATERTAAAPRPTAKGRTAFDPDDAPDAEPPAAVTTISPAKVTPDELALSWPAATDNRRVIGYRIWLNGYEVATTAQTRATLHWFNDEGQHVVQIKAIDAAGNQSETWSTLLVTRPSPEPTEPTRPPEPSVTATPEPSPKPSETASPGPKGDPSPRVAPAPTAAAPKPTASAE